MVTIKALKAVIEFAKNNMAHSEIANEAEKELSAIQSQLTPHPADEGDSADTEDNTNPYLLSASEIERWQALRG